MTLPKIPNTRYQLLFRVLLIIHSSLFINHCLAQFSPQEQKSIDSLNAILNNKNSHDTARASAYLVLSDLLHFSNLDTLIPLCVKAQQIAEKALAKNPPKIIAGSLKKTMADSYSNMAYAYKNQNKTKEALTYYNKSLMLQKEIGNQNGIAISLINIGAIYKNQGRIKEAIEYQSKALKTWEIVGNKKGIASSLNGIGVIYVDQGQTEEALDYLGRSCKIREEIGDKKGVATCLNNIGYVYDNQGQIDDALKYYGKSLEVSREIDDKKGMARAYNNIGGLLCSLDSLGKGFNYLNKALDIFINVNDKEWIAYTYNKLGHWQFKTGNLIDACKNSTEALKIAEKIGYVENIKRASKLLYQIYEKQGEGMKALEMHKLFIEMRDSINNMETQKASLKNQMQYEYEKEQAATQAEQDKKDLLIKEEKEKQQIVLYATGGGLVLVSVFLFLLFNRFKTTQRQKSIIEKQKHLVDEKQKEILDSIRYAKRIQDAILPSMSAMQQTLRNGFVLYKPKDVVAGDFYWMETTSVIERSRDARSNSEMPAANSPFEGGLRGMTSPPVISSGAVTEPSRSIEKGTGIEKLKVLPSGEDLGGAIFFAAADCTGHGVPGAMMSVVCSNALSKALLEEKAQTTGELLDKTRTLVIDRLAKSGEEVKDGMDISLCSLTFPQSGGAGGGLLQWSGANNPLWIVRSSSKNDSHSVAEPVEAPAANSPFEGGKGDVSSPSVIERNRDARSEPSQFSNLTSQYSLLEFRPDKQPIGMFADAKPFTTHTIELQKGDTIYIFTDGYQDQFGGDKSKKFKASKLKELILSIQNETMDTQKEILNNEFENWKGTLEQVDDVCVIGVRI